MTDINEKETIDYFIQGIRKAKGAAKELALLNQRGDWMTIRTALDQIEQNAVKLATGRAQTRLQTLAMAAQIEAAPAAAEKSRVPQSKPKGLLH